MMSAQQMKLRGKGAMPTAWRGHAENVAKHGHSEQWPWHPQAHWLRSYH